MKYNFYIFLIFFNSSSFGATIPIEKAGFQRGRIAIVAI